MKRLLNFRSAAAFLILTGAMMTFMSMNNVPVKSPVGTWNYEAETPDGDIEDVMTITQDEDGNYQVTISTTVYGDLILQDVTFEKMVMEGSVELQGDSIEFEFNFDGDSMQGSAYIGEEEFTITAEREKK